MLEVRDLSVSYGKHRALEGASLRVGKGEIVVILGANGAGKTTLLKAICGISEGKTSGTVNVEGQSILGQKPDRIVEAGIALVPEGRGIFADLTVRENLMLGAYADRARTEEAGNLERVLSLFPTLAVRSNQVVRTMSGGEQQMVAIGRAMMSNPLILALDEPSLGLSPLLCKDLFQSFLAIKKAGIGVILVEQNAKQSLKIADRGYLLENGCIVHEDDADRLSRDPAVQKAYLGASGGSIAPDTAHAVERSQTQLRPASGPTPSDIAAAALKSVASRPRPPLPNLPGSTTASVSRLAPTSPAAPPASRNSALSIDKLVARAASMSSRRPTTAKTNGGTQPSRTPDSQTGQSLPRTPQIPTSTTTDRLRTVLEEIEAAARRAEAYKSRDRRR